jgi:hypothetical protein
MDGPGDRSYGLFCNCRVQSKAEPPAVTAECTYRQLLDEAATTEVRISGMLGKLTDPEKCIALEVLALGRVLANRSHRLAALGTWTLTFAAAVFGN